MFYHLLKPMKTGCKKHIVFVAPKSLIVEAGVIDRLKMDTVLMLRMPLIPSDTDMLFKFNRRQFPIWLAFLMNINRSQGQTFDKVCLYIQKPVFSHRQNYVAF
jgi:ATP-dependent DNA helicase PIF1